MFQSITISKSEEDIRASEMNAREITESDVSQQVTTPDVEGSIPRIHSFLRKQQEEENLMSEAMENTDVASESVVEIANGEQEANTEEHGDNVSLSHRDSKSSSCEPETIAFLGKKFEMSQSSHQKI